MANEVFRLDGEYAAEWSRLGLKIFPYFTEDEVIRQDLGPGFVLLGEFAQSELTAAICDARSSGGCDMYRDLAKECADLRAGLLATLEKLRGTTQTLNNMVTEGAMSDDCRTTLENEWTNVLKIFAETHSLIEGKGGNDE